MKTQALFLFVLLALGPGCSRGHSDTAPGALPSSWYTLPEHQTTTTTAESQDFHTDPKTDAAVSSVFQANTAALSGVSSPSAPQASDNGGGDGDTVPWHLDGAIADFALSTNGILGTLLSNGTYAIRGTWQRTTSTVALKNTLGLQKRAAVTVRPNSTVADITNQIEPAVRSALAAGLIHRENESDFRANLKNEGNKFLGLCQELNSLQLNTGWAVSTFELQISFNANGQINPLIGVGGAFNLYFDWVKPDFGAVSAPAPAPDNGLAQFAQTVTSEVSQALLESPDPADAPLVLTVFQVGLGITAGGDIGVAQWQAGVSGRIMFQKTAVKPALVMMKSLGHLNLIKASTRSEEREFATQMRVPFHPADDSGAEIFQIDLDKFRKGLKNALKMGRYFVQRAKESETTQWKLTEIETELDLSIGGDLKLVTLTGTGQVLLDFDRADAAL